MLLVVPSDPLRPRRAADHWAREATAARTLGIEVALVDHDAWERGDVTATVARMPVSTDIVYRGWMVSVEQYTALSDALRARGSQLRTSPQNFATAHQLPGWAPAMAGLTPPTAVVDGFTREAFVAALAGFGDSPVVLRDHVKSAKHEWDTACFVPDASDTDTVWRVASRLRDIRGDAATGGFVIRGFVDLRGPEVRTWWVGGQCVLITAHPDEPAADRDQPDGLDHIIAACAPRLGQLDPGFVTVDFAHGEGGWWLIEVGDGQVSDLHREVAPDELLSALALTGR